MISRPSAPIERPEEAAAAREVTRLLAWCIECFVAAGCNHELAVLLAESGIDHHELEKLVARGCAPELAARILLPT